MLTDNILTLLIAERDKLSRAIEALQGGTAKRRGRPPKNPLAAVAAPAEPKAPKKRKRRSAAQRKAQAARMKEYWAKRKKQEKR